MDIECTHPASSYTPDEFGRVSSFAVSGFNAQGLSSWGGRNLSHAEAHRIADDLVASGWHTATAHVETF